ncbi:hypothetical protein [Polaromonas naphthalenivorans]|uniref:hypothetical protein n=1 Tax=Polaromonas naphthalenivorans TaxID=216465 RepID=UPI0012EEA774|nr:hypothetical protein [Polaromonas naphthalenivorans]
MFTFSKGCQRRLFGDVVFVNLFSAALIIKSPWETFRLRSLVVGNFALRLASNHLLTQLIPLTGAKKLVPISRIVMDNGYLSLIDIEISRF